MAVPAPVASITQSTELAAVQERKRRELIRWMSLQHINAARPTVMADMALLPLIQTAYSDAALRELRRELDYLMECGLLTVAEDYEAWRLKLTRHGIDLVEYTTPCPPGIGRPASLT